MKIKKILGAFSAVLIFVAMSVPAFALNASEWISDSSIKILNNSTGVVGELKTSMLDSAGRAFIQNFIDGVGYWTISYVGGFTRFSYWATSPSFTSNSSTGQISSATGTYLDFSGTDCSPRAVTVNGITSFVVTHSGIGPYNIGNAFIQYQIIVDSGIPKSHIGAIWKPVRDSPTGAFTVTYDDMGSNAPDPEPTPPPFVPETPDITPPFENPSLPVIPKIENDYVPYDTTIWNGFLSNILGKIKTIVIYGFFIMLFLMSIRIVLNLIKTYAKPR